MHPAVRFGVAILALVVGAAVGALTTFAHGSTPPWFLLGGLVVVAAFVLGVRLSVAQPLVTGAAVAAVVGSALVLAMVEGDVVVVAADALGIAWLAGVTLVALGSALWPLPGPRRQGNPSESS